MQKSELEATEYQEFYGTYLNAIDDVNLIEELINGKKWMTSFIENLDESKLSYSHARGKWTVAEVLMHIIDTERVFQYRAFRFSKNDKTELPGFDQDEYMLETHATSRSKESILQEYISVRDASLTIYQNLTDLQIMYTGTASNIQWSVAGLGFVTSGHQKHHATILEEKYF